MGNKKVSAERSNDFTIEFERCFSSSGHTAVDLSFNRLVKNKSLSVYKHFHFAERFFKISPEWYRIFVTTADLLPGTSNF